MKNSQNNYIALEGGVQSSPTFDGLIIQTLTTPIDSQALAARRLRFGCLPTGPSTHSRAFGLKNLVADKALNLSGVSVDGLNKDNFIVSSFPGTEGDI